MKTFKTKQVAPVHALELGESFKGFYLGKKTMPSQYGTLTLHRFQEDRGFKPGPIKYIFGSADLNKILEETPRRTWLWIKYVKDIFFDSPTSEYRLKLKKFEVAHWAN